MSAPSPSDPHASLAPTAEAQRLLAGHPDPGSPAALAAAMAVMTAQFAVLQQRSQLLLTLGTLVLTITGFSGPKIVDESALARLCMPIGIVLVLAAMVIILLSSLRIRWVTQFTGSDAQDTLVRIIRYRNTKTTFYRAELFLLVVGMIFYVLSVVAYMVKDLALS